MDGFLGQHQVGIVQGNRRSLFHQNLLAYAKEGRALDAVSDSWEVLDFSATDAVLPSEMAVWEEVASQSAMHPATFSHASPSAFAVCVVSAHNRSLHIDAAFSAWVGGLDLQAGPHRELVRQARAGLSLRKVLDDTSGRPILVIGLERAKALKWPISEAGRLALDTDESAVALVAFAPSRAHNLEAHVRNAFKLTAAEARLAIALLHYDRLEDVASALGIAEVTANGYRKTLFKKVGAKRRGELVKIVLEIAHRERPADQKRADHALRDMFGLNEDQLDMLNRIAMGESIPEASRKLGINIHTGRDMVRRMFETVGVNKQSELIRIVCEYEALTAFSHASEVQAAPHSELLNHTRVLARPDGSLIYLCDYGHHGGGQHGSARGIPVLYFHTTMSTRRLAPGLIAAAKAAGLRLIAIERPGFGGTDLRTEAGYEGAAHDAALVLDHLGIDRVWLMTLSSGNAPGLSFAAIYPDRVLGGLLINPSTPATYSQRYNAPGGALLQMAFANPKLIRAMAITLRNQLRSDLVDRAMGAYFTQCEADRRALAMPGIRALQRSNIQASLARTVDGFVHEEEVFANNWMPPPLAHGRWIVAVGMEDHTCDWRQAAQLWSGLPGFQFVAIPDAGRMILISQSQQITSLLSQLIRGEQVVPRRERHWALEGDATRLEELTAA